MYKGPGMDGVQPIRWYFVVDQVPAGEAPLEIRQAWVGLVLPLRHDRPAEAPFPLNSAGVETLQPVHIDDGVVVTLVDAITALSAAGRSGAAAYWEVRNAATGVPALAFRAAEGRILPVASARKFLSGDLPDE
jgi:hypothetical protein